MANKIFVKSTKSKQLECRRTCGECGRYVVINSVSLVYRHWCHLVMCRLTSSEMCSRNWLTSVHYVLATATLGHRRFVCICRNCILAGLLVHDSKTNPQQLWGKMFTAAGPELWNNLLAIIDKLAMTLNSLSSC